MTKELNQKIIDLYKKGLSLQKIADTVGISQPTVWRIVPKSIMRDTKPRGAMIMNDKIAEKIRALYNEGMSLRAIGETIGISHESVRKVIPDDDKRRKRLTRDEIKQILSAYRSSGSFQKAADILDIDRRQLVYYVVDKYGSEKDKANENSIRRSRV